MNLNPQNRQQLLGIIALAAVAIWAGDRLVLTPLVQSWRDRSAGIVELRKSVRDGRQLLERERTIRDRWEGMRTNTLPREASEAQGRVIKAFDQWSQASRVSVTSVDPHWKHNADEYSTLECRVDGFGSLATITRFLYEIEKDPLALKVDSLSLTASESNGSQLKFGLMVSGLLLISTEP
jgi:hypothetical protein